MPLSEQQIHRYSRQILLADVGGKGQSRLLESGSQVVGDGPAAQDAAAYLAGSGVRVALRGMVQAEEAGFLASAAGLRGGRPGRVGRTVRGFNPDASWKPGQGCLAALSAPVSRERPPGRLR